MNRTWPVRRPLVPVALAGLAGTLVGLFLTPAPLVWMAFCLVSGAAGWWGPKKIRSPAVWIFVVGVFALHVSARAFALAADALRAR